MKQSKLIGNLISLVDIQYPAVLSAYVFTENRTKRDRFIYPHCPLTLFVMGKQKLNAYYIFLDFVCIFIANVCKMTKFK